MRWDAKSSPFIVQLRKDNLLNHVHQKISPPALIESLEHWEEKSREHLAGSQPELERVMPRQIKAIRDMRRKIVTHQGSRPTP